MLYADSNRTVEQTAHISLYYNKAIKRWTVDRVSPEPHRKTFKKLEDAKHYYAQSTK